MVARRGVGLTIARKPGKLPFRTVDESFDLEYGSATLQMHEDSLIGKRRILIVDDLLATGGTALAALSLVERCAATVVECAFVIELTDLPGRKRLEERGQRVHALTTFSEAE